MDLLSNYLRDLGAVPFNMNLRISLVYLLCTVVLAGAIWI